MTIIKSIHIKECWPFEYIAPVIVKKKVISQASKDKANERKRRIYAERKQQLRTFELNNDICNRLNNNV